MGEKGLHSLSPAVVSDSNKFLGFSFLPSKLILINYIKLYFPIQTLTLFRMGFFGAAHGWGGLKLDETWHRYTLPREDPKNA